MKICEQEKEVSALKQDVKQHVYGTKSTLVEL